MSNTQRHRDRVAANQRQERRKAEAEAARRTTTEGFAKAFPKIEPGKKNAPPGSRWDAKKGKFVPRAEFYSHRGGGGGGIDGVSAAYKANIGLNRPEADFERAIDRVIDGVRVDPGENALVSFMESLGYNQGKPIKKREPGAQPYDVVRIPRLSDGTRFLGGAPSPTGVPKRKLGDDVRTVRANLTRRRAAGLNGPGSASLGLESPLG